MKCDKFILVKDNGIIHHLKEIHELSDTDANVQFWNKLLKQTEKGLQWYHWFHALNIFDLNYEASDRSPKLNHNLNRSDPLICSVLRT
jgi:hypothetical protein